VVERNGQVMADSAGADDKIFEKGYRRSFAVLSPASQYAAAIVRSIAELADPKPKTVAILSADDGFSKTAAEGGAAEAQKQGMTVFPTEFFPSGATDVSSSLTKIKNKRPDLIIGSVHLAEGVAIIKQSRELGVVPGGGFGETVAPPTPDFAQTLGAAAENVVGSTQWTPQTVGSDSWFGTALDYTSTFQNAYHRTPEYHNAEATAACLALVLAAQKAGSTQPDQIRDALAALDTPSFFGPIKFDETGKNVSKPMGVIQIQHGKPVTVWPKDAAEAALVWPAARP
jgi:branched-chain amino acid transport system substrate-binding protein